MIKGAFFLASKSTFIILIIAIAVLSLTLAVMTGYLFIVQDTSNDKGNPDIVVKNVPKKADRITIPLFEDKRIYNLNNGDTDKNSMIQVAVTLDCYKQLENDKKAIVEDRVAAYSDEIQELLVQFFLTKTIDDVKDVVFMDKTKEELAGRINNLLNEGEKNPEDIVYKVIFSEWQFQ
jgi:flagellar basal body-associated protein FliL